MRPSSIRLLLGVFLCGPALMGPGTESAAQEQVRRWERRIEASEPPPTAFHATDVIALPTAETLARGEWQFEISHRFLPALSEGSDAFWGLDGPVNMRLGLGYALSDRVLITLARANLQDNVDLRLKWRTLEVRAGSVPILLALQGGAGWSTDVSDRDATDPGNRQYYGQLILNAAPSERLAVGIVPSYLHNVLLDKDDLVSDLYLGLTGQLFLTDVFSVNAEWNLGKNRGDFSHDAGAFGVEMETGGHFFKVFVTNSIRLNPSQYLVGTDFDFSPDNWRLGFGITRLLRF